MQIDKVTSFFFFFFFFFLLKRVSGLVTMTVSCMKKVPIITQNLAKVCIDKNRMIP